MPFLYFFPSHGKACTWRSPLFSRLHQEEGGQGVSEQTEFNHIFPPLATQAHCCFDAPDKENLCVFFFCPRNKASHCQPWETQNIPAGQEFFMDISSAQRRKGEKKAPNYSKFMVIALMRQNPLECKHAQQYTKKQSKKKCLIQAVL